MGFYLQSLVIGGENDEVRVQAAKEVKMLGFSCKMAGSEHLIIKVIRVAHGETHYSGSRMLVIGKSPLILNYIRGQSPGPHSSAAKKMVCRKDRTFL
jgi:hypothetical protein